MYLGGNISSRQSDDKIIIFKVCNAIDSLPPISKSDLLDEIEQIFFKAITMSVLLYGCSTLTLRKCLEKK